MTDNRVTLRDVARQAGVSHQTVSRVINGSDKVRPATKAHVEAVIAELDYRPNAMARSMARGRSGILACIAPNLTDYTFASIIEGAQSAAREHDYFLLSASAHDEAQFSKLVDQLVNTRRTEGIIVINPYVNERYRHLPDDVPVVFAGARPREDSTTSVALDDVVVAREATEHLLSLGHRTIGMVTGPMEEDCCQDRHLGYCQALQAATLPVDDELIIEGDWSPESGYNGLCTLLAKENRLTALFMQNDSMAVGALRAARDLDLRVPEDLSVISVDDIPYSSFFTPPLTTFRQDFEFIGAEATRLLAEAIENPTDERTHLLISAELVLRRSTDAPPATV
ncbi:MAG: LacI family transcriptional regulator [Anaerolineae bacterium]|nr:LacI family transcriptional regulator [Anaerolineae bacterium]MCO5197044.1 LacI family transcriptional regulator [Anaerolineae bacterium]